MVGRERYPLSTTKSIFLMQGGFGDRDGMGMCYGMRLRWVHARTCAFRLSEVGRLAIILRLGTH